MLEGEFSLKFGFPFDIGRSGAGRLQLRRRAGGKRKAKQRRRETKRLLFHDTPPEIDGSFSLGVDHDGFM
jgi:hypothetical protein